MQRRWTALASAVGGLCVALGAYAASPQWDQSIAIVDSADPHKQATVTSTGALKVDGSAAGGGTVTLGAGSALVGKVGIDQTTPGTTDSVTVKTQAYTSPATITRPANQTPYTANDVLGGAITFASAGPSAGGDLLITSVELEADIAAIPAGMTTFSLYLYNVTPPSAVADNGAFDLAAGDRASFIGKIVIGAPVDEGSTLYYRADNVNAHIKTASGSVFGYLVTSGGFTPAANSEVYKVTLHGVAP